MTLSEIEHALDQIAHTLRIIGETEMTVAQWAAERRMSLDTVEAQRLGRRASRFHREILNAEPPKAAIYQTHSYTPVTTHNVYPKAVLDLAAGDLGWSI